MLPCWEEEEEEEQTLRAAVANAALRVAVALWFDDNAAAVARYGPIGDWDTRDVKSMRALFEHRADFNEDIGQWNVGSVEDMHAMFNGATKFNQPLDKWDVSSVKDMSYMFFNAASFNQPLWWDVRSVEHMNCMLAGAASLNQLVTLCSFDLVLPSPSPSACARVHAVPPY